MGRQPNVPQLTRNGTYRCWHPGVKKYVNLGTQDYGQALAIQAGFYGRKTSPALQSTPAAPNSPSVGEPAFPYSSGGRDEGSAMTLDLDDKPTDAASILTQWSQSGKPETPAQTPSVAPSSPSLWNPQPSASTPNLAPVSAGTGKPGRKAKPSLTPEQSAQLASGLKKIVANLNVIIIGAGVQMFGKVPAPLDDDEVKMLEMGWAMFIDELFLKTEVKPWHVLLAGNVMIAAAMYVGGTPIPKKQLPANDPTKAKSASVTPIDGGKPNV